MSTINVTIDVGDDCVGKIAGILRRFPKGQRVRVVFTDEPDTHAGSKVDLVDWLLACPDKNWFEPIKPSETTDDINYSPLE